MSGWVGWAVQERGQSQGPPVHHSQTRPGQSSSFHCSFYLQFEEIFSKSVVIWYGIPPGFLEIKPFLNGFQNEYPIIYAPTFSFRFVIKLRFNLH